MVHGLHGFSRIFVLGNVFNGGCVDCLRSK